MIIMKEIEIQLPKLCRRGPAPTVVLTHKILKMVKIKYPIVSNSHNLVYKVLNEFYTNRMYTQTKIGEIFGVQSQTVKRWLMRLNIPIRERYDFLSRRLLKYKRESFSGNKREMAYLLGLRSGDIYAQKHGRFIRVSVSTTHPAMLHLFKKSFRRYGKVNMYPKYDKKGKRFLWCIYCDLDYSFKFLIKKNKTIPEWVINDNNLFFSFLSGYFDSEGCISIYFDGKSGNLQWIIQTCDKGILDAIVSKLNDLGVELQSPRLIKEADHERYEKDYWFIGTGRRSQVLNLLNQMHMKHEEKTLKHKLAEELVETNWRSAKEKIFSLRAKIKNDIKECMEKARLRYLQTHK